MKLRYVGVLEAPMKSIIIYICIMNPYDGCKTKTIQGLAQVAGDTTMSTNEVFVLFDDRKTPPAQWPAKVGRN